MSTSGRERLFAEKVWVPSHSPLHFEEMVDENGDDRFILSGLMLPFGKISRNNVLYNRESVIEKHKQLQGRPVMYNHQVEGDNLPKGHFIETTILEKPAPGWDFTVPGWYYKADIDPEERNLIRKLKRGDLKNVSIQLLGGKVMEKIDAEGKRYIEAHVQDVIEGSIVVAPGFLDTTAKFAESLGIEPEAVEQVSSAMDNAKDMLLFTIGRVEESDLSDEEFVKLKLDLIKKFQISEDESAHIISGALVAIQRMLGMEVINPSEDITTTTGDGAIGPALMALRKKRQANKLAEGVIRKIGEEEVKRLLSEKVLNAL